MLLKVNLEDSGMYQCLAENEHSVVYASAELKVVGEWPCFYLSIIRRLKIYWLYKNTQLLPITNGKKKMLPFIKLFLQTFLKVQWRSPRWFKKEVKTSLNVGHMHPPRHPSHGGKKVICWKTVRGRDHWPSMQRRHAKDFRLVQPFKFTHGTCQCFMILARFNLTAYSSCN